jgi:hypothetical protein
MGRSRSGCLRGSLPAPAARLKRGSPVYCLDERLSAACFAPASSFASGTLVFRRHIPSLTLSVEPHLECCHCQRLGNALSLERGTTDIERHSFARIGD